MDPTRRHPDIDLGEKARASNGREVNEAARKWYTSKAELAADARYYSAALDQGIPRGMDDAEWFAAEFLAKPELQRYIGFLNEIRTSFGEPEASYSFMHGLYASGGADGPYSQVNSFSHDNARSQADSIRARFASKDRGGGRDVCR